MFLRVQSYNPLTRKFNVLPVRDGDITTTSPKPNSPQGIVNVPVDVPATPSDVWSRESTTQLPGLDAPATSHGVELSDRWSTTSDPDIKLNPAAGTVNASATASEWCGRQSDIQPWHDLVTPNLEPEAPLIANTPVTSPDDSSDREIDLLDSGWPATSDPDCFDSFGLEVPGALTELVSWDQHSTDLLSYYDPSVEPYRHPSLTYDNHSADCSNRSVEFYNLSFGYDDPCHEEPSVGLCHEPSELGLSSWSSPAPSSSPECTPPEKTPPESTPPESMPPESTPPESTSPEKTTPEKTPPEIHVSDEADDKMGEWEAIQIIGEEVIGGEVHYMVMWKPTLEPERNLEHMKGLIKDWWRRETLRKGTGRISKRARGRPRRST